MRHLEVGADESVIKVSQSDTVTFTIYAPAPTASLPAATTGPGIIYDTTTDTLKFSNGTAWTTFTTA